MPECSGATPRNVGVTVAHWLACSSAGPLVMGSISHRGKLEQFTKVTRSTYPKLGIRKQPCESKGSQCEIHHITH